MWRSASILLALAALSCNQPAEHRSSSAEMNSHGRTAGHEMAGAGASAPQAHTVVLSDQIAWKDGPAGLPPGAQYAVLEGDPSKPGYFAMRARMPDGYKVPAHWHPQVERLTVLSGTLHLGTGDKLNTGSGHALPAGSYTAMPAGMRHYAWAEGPTVIQINTMGPWDIIYVNPSDDPRKQGK